MGIFLGSEASPKSDIECVILAGSSLFASAGEITISVVELVVLGARSARFFKDFDVLAAENLIFSLASQGWRHKRLRVWA